MARLTTRIVFDREDLEAYKRDVLAIFIEFGGYSVETVQPHRRAGFEAEMKRATKALGECMRFE